MATAPERGRVLALLPGEPAGRISTVNAGAVSFSATLSWCPSDGMPSGPTLCDPPPGARFYHLVQRDDAASATREVSCQIRALHLEELTAALEAVLRSVATHAALTEAVLETSAVRLANPSVTPASLAEALARQLSDAGLRASFGPSWTPAPGANASVGTGNSEDAFRDFLATHPAWRPQPRRP